MTITVENIPLELRQRRQWVTWKPKADGSKGFAGRYSDDASTWLSFEQVQNEPYIAYVFSAEDPYFGIDLDDCLVDGKLSPPAQHIVDMFAGVGYTEISSSGCGTKITCRGEKPSSMTRSRYTIDGQEIEVYSQKRFWCMTGNPFPINQPTNLVDANKQIEAFAKWLKVVKPTEPPQQQRQQQVATRAASSSSTDFRIQRAERYLKRIPDPKAPQGPDDKGNRNNTIYEAAGGILVIANNDGEVLSNDIVTDLLLRRFGHCDSELTREYILQRVQAAGKDNPRPLKLPKQEEIPDFSHLYKKTATPSTPTASSTSSTLTKVGVPIGTSTTLTKKAPSEAIYEYATVSFGQHDRTMTITDGRSAKKFDCVKQLPPQKQHQEEPQEEPKKKKEEKLPRRENNIAGRIDKHIADILAGREIQTYTTVNVKDITLAAGRLTLLGAEPGTGKTTLATQIVFDILSEYPNAKILVASCEMSFEILLEKTLSRLSQIPASLIAKPSELSDEQKQDIINVGEIIKKDADRLVFFEDVFAAEQILQVARQEKCNIVLVDYVQELQAVSQNSLTSINQNIQTLSQGCRQDNFALFVVSAIRRLAVSNADKATIVPSMSWFRDSSSLEYAASYAYILMAKEEEQAILLGDGAKIQPKVIAIHTVKNRYGSRPSYPAEYEFAQDIQSFSFLPLGECWKDYPAEGGNL